jgi:hypothetical protein
MTTRRAFLGGAGVAALGGLDAALLPPGQAGADATEANARSRAAFRLRRDAAHAYLGHPEPPQHSNGDEERYADRRASFSKTLPHNDLGEVKPEAYKEWLAILAAGDPKGFERVPRDPAATVKLNNPQAAYAFDLVGVDPHATRLAPAPAFVSARMACEMAEVYWLALTADVPFRGYESHQLIAAALADLNSFSAPLGPGPHRKLTPGTLFRGETPGDLAGPYVSQFLWLDVPYGMTTIQQRYRSPGRGQGFLTDYKEWLACQSGMGTGARLRFDPEPRFICSNRDLAGFVHRDFPYQAYLNAALIMLGFSEGALSPTNPYRGSRTQVGGMTFGGPNVLSLLGAASLIALKGSYYHKWLVHRRLRPESFAGRVETHLSGRKKYDIHADVLGCDAVSRVRSAYGTRLLPCAYPEGCPTHPSYPAAHAANAGACATILKAFFHEELVFPGPVQAKEDGSDLEPWRGRDLTLGGEINKLANNITLGRDAAGVHYRSDGVEGLSIGERQAIGILCDYSRAYNEHFDGFALTRFDGQKVKIANGTVTVA